MSQPKVAILVPHDGPVLTEFPWESTDSIAHAVGDPLFERVAIHLSAGLPGEWVMCARRFSVGGPINPIASVLYGVAHHGDHLLGSVVIAKVIRMRDGTMPTLTSVDLDVEQVSTILRPIVEAMRPGGIGR